MRIVGAVRVSTLRQAGDERKSLPYQRQVIADETDRLGGELVEVLVFAESGHKSKWRDELERIKETAKRLKADMVMTSELDRLARRQHWQGQFVEDLDKAGMRYRAVLDDLDTAREGDRVKLLALGMVSEIFVMSLKRKVKGGMKLRAEDGKPNGRLPYGYLKDSAGVWHPDPLRAPWVQRIFEWRISGVGIPTITRWLIEQEAPPPTPGKPWYERAVRELLRRPAYKGNLKWGAVEREGALPILVPEVMWDNVQQLNDARTSVRTRTGASYILGGLLRAHCGCGMAGMRSGELRQSGERPRIYRTQCHKWRSGHKPSSVSADWIESQVLEHLDQLFRAGAPTAVIKPAPPKTEAIEFLIRENRAKLDRLEDSLLEGRIVGERYDRRKQEIEQEYARLTAARDSAPRKDAEILAQVAAELATDWEQSRKRSEPTEIKAVLQRLVERIEIGPATGSRKAEREVVIHLRSFGGG